MDFPIVKPVIV